jgi:AraC-like DNA-binding protein
MSLSLYKVLNSIALLNATLFLGFALSRLLEPHKSEKQIWSLMANIFGSLSFNLPALDRFHWLGPSGLDPTLVFFLDIVSSPLLCLFFLSESDTQFHFRWRHATSLLLVGVFTGSHLVYRVVHSGAMPLALQIVLGYCTYAWFILFQVLFLGKIGFSIVVKRLTLTKVRILNIGMASAWTIWGLLAVLFLTSPYRIVVSASGTVLFLALMTLYPLKTSVPLALEDLRTRTRYTKSKIIGVDVPQVTAKLDVLMRKEKLFRQEDLSLSDLAARVNLTPHQLSELLNQVLDATFTQYINGWRLKEVQRLLLDEPDKSVLEVAFDCGFGSKSVFNSFFVRATGLTPKEYRKQGRLVAENRSPAVS